MAATCRYCKNSVLWWRSPSGSWRAVDPVAVAWTPDVRGVVIHRTKGMVDAGTAWPEPDQCLPLHRCHEYEMHLALDQLDDDSPGMRAVPVEWDRWMTESAAPIWWQAPDYRRWAVRA